MQLQATVPNVLRTNRHTKQAAPISVFTIAGRAIKRIFGQTAVKPVRQQAEHPILADSIAGDRLKQKVARVKQEMGGRLINHPDYCYTPRHSNNPEIYGPLLAERSAEISRLAQESRDKNPAYLRSQRLVQHLKESME